MGNGRWSGSASESSTGSSRRRWIRFGAMGAIMALMVAASALLGLSFRRFQVDQAATEASLSSHSTSSMWSTGSSEADASGTQPSVSNGSAHSRLDVGGALGQLPLIFEPNQGQADAAVKFLARGLGYGLFLNESGAELALQSASKSRKRPSEQFVRMKFVDANRKAVATGTERLPGHSNYFIGNDPDKWHSGVPQFAGVRYASVYPGIDLVFYGNQGHLEYDFRVAPGFDATRAELEFDGAGKVELKDGDLIVYGKNENRSKSGDQAHALVRLRAPQVYQGDGDRRVQIAGRFALRGDNRVGFAIGPYDRSRELVIDPVLQFSTYFGGSGTETSPSVAVNSDGFIYLAGSTTSPPSSFPLNGGPSTTLGSTPNIFVAKISPSQPPSVQYLTFLGGNGADSSVGVAVDGGGNVYVAGNTTSSNFPTTSLAYQTAPAAKVAACTATTCSIFVSVLNSLGSALTYSSYLSGNGDDVASGMTIDAQQDMFVTGTTTSNNPASNGVAFPATLLPVPFEATPLSSIQFFVTKINTKVPGVGGIAYSTYFGGSTPASPVAAGGGVAVDSTGNIYFSGTTNFYNSGSGLYGYSGSGDFPILNAYQPCLDTIPPTSLVNSNPCSPPTTTPYPSDAFMAKLYPLGQAGAQLIFSTYFGGATADSSTAIAIDPGATSIYLTGATNSTTFVLPTGTQAFQGCLNDPGPVVTSTTSCPTSSAPANNTDAYVAQFSNAALSTSGTPNVATLTYFSYLGGGGNEVGTAIAVDTAKDALVTGSTNSGTANPPNFPTTTGAIQSVLNGTQNAFFAHIDTSTTTSNNQVGSYSTYFGGNAVDRGTSIAVDPSLNTYFVGDTTSTNLEVDNPFGGAGGTTLGGARDAFVVKLGTATDLCITCTLPVISPTGTVSAGNPVTITYTLANNGPDVATNVIVSGLVPTGVTFNSASAGSGTCSTQTGTTVACQIPTLQAGATSTVVFTVTPTAPGTYEATATVSAANNTNTVNTQPVSFTASGFSVTIAPAAQTVAAGQSAQYTVVVSPTAGVFGANVSLTCSSLPSGAACNFTTSTITLSGGAGSASTVLNLSTTAQPTPTARMRWGGPFYAFWLMMPGIALLGWGAGGKRRRRWLGVIALMALFGLVLLLPACHSAKTQPTVAGTPSGTYPLTVTATSGSVTQSAPFSVTVVP